MMSQRKIIPLLLLLALPACGGEVVDESEHGGAAIPDSLGIAADSLPTPQLPALLQDSTAP